MKYRFLYGQWLVGNAASYGKGDSTHHGVPIFLNLLIGKLCFFCPLVPAFLHGYDGGSIRRNEQTVCNPR